LLLFYKKVTTLEVVLGLLPFYEIAANQQQLMLFFKISSNQLSEFMRFEKIAATQDEFPLFYSRCRFFY